MNYLGEDVQDFRNHHFAFLDVKVQQHQLKLTLNRPEKKNALNPTMMKEIAFCLSYAHYTPDIWAVIIKANGTVFCAGADLKSFAGEPEAPNNSTIPEPRGEILLGELFNQVHKPCIAVVDAPAFAGAFLILCGCHFVLASHDATFSLTEVRRGIWPMQVMASLLTIMNQRTVLNLCLSARTIDAIEAHQLGIVTHLCQTENLQHTLELLLSNLFEGAPTAIRMGLKAIDELRTIELHHQHAYLKKMLKEVLNSEDAREGLQAFIEKRPPKWTGL